MDLLITIQIAAETDDLAWSLQRHLREAGGPWTVELLDHSDTVRVRVPANPGLQALIGPVFQWLLPRQGVRSVTLTAPDGEHVTVSAEDAAQQPPEPVYPPSAPTGTEEPADEEDDDYSDSLAIPPGGETGVSYRPVSPSRERSTPPGPVIDPDDDWPRER